MIEYPKRLNETEIQFTLCQKLRGLGIDTRLQVRAFEKQKRSRLDIVIFKDKQARCIIGCKSWSKSYMRNQRWQKSKNSKQVRKYRECFHLPVLMCGCHNAIGPVIHIVQKILLR